MLKSIKEFLYSFSPDIVVQAPARINLINPLDAVEADFWMPSVAINGKNNPLSVFIYIKKIKHGNRLKIYEVNKSASNYSFELINEERLLKEEEEIKQKLKEQNKLIYASFYRLYKVNSYFKEVFLTSNIEIGLITTIPPQSGLGGSSSIIIAVLYGLSIFFDIFNNFDVLNENEVPINKDVIAEMATKIEDEDLQITAGYGDRYVISRGGLCFCSYYGKIEHKALSMEPLAVYDRIGDTYEINDLPVIICFSGISHDSGDVHKELRSLYLKKKKKIIRNYEKLAKISWKSRFALMKHDWKLLGNYFKENNIIMNRVMRKAGFKFGIGLANNILIKIIEENSDVYGVKLTGAGIGGSIFALVKPNKIEVVMKRWKKKLTDLIMDEGKFHATFPSYPVEIMDQLQNVSFYEIKIDKSGVKRL